MIFRKQKAAEAVGQIALNRLANSAAYRHTVD
jgi:hypothetical protein